MKLLLAALSLFSASAYSAPICGKPELVLTGALSFSSGAYSKALAGYIRIDDFVVPGILGNKGIISEFVIVTQKAISEGKQLCYEYEDGAGMLTLAP